MRLHILAASALLALATSCATFTNSTPAQGERFGPSKGQSEVSFGGTLSSQELETDFGSFDSDSLIAQASYGHYLTDEVEVGGQLITSFSDSEGSETTAIGIQPYGRYNFRLNERTVAYAGVHLGLLHFIIDDDFSDESETAFSYGVHGGFKSWLNPTTAFFVEPRYTETSFDEFDINQFDIILGFAITF